jgi:hypothetical protein
MWPAASPGLSVIASSLPPADGVPGVLRRNRTSRVPEEDKMATTLQTTDTATTTYTMLVIFTVHPDSDQNLHDQQAIRDEARSWLESLDATVHGVNIRKAEAASQGRLRFVLHVGAWRFVSVVRSLP